MIGRFKGTEKEEYVRNAFMSAYPETYVREVVPYIKSLHSVSKLDGGGIYPETQLARQLITRDRILFGDLTFLVTRRSYEVIGQTGYLKITVGNNVFGTNKGKEFISDSDAEMNVLEYQQWGGDFGSAPLMVGPIKDYDPYFAEYRNMIFSGMNVQAQHYDMLNVNFVGYQIIL